MSHTPGKLRIGTPPPNGEQTIGTYQGLMVAVATTGIDMPTKANARRLVACWNACDGISTNTLEALRTPIKDISCIPGLVADIDALRAVNAELVEALEGFIGVINAAGIYNLSRGVQLGQTVWYVKASDAMESSRAALAKAKELKGTE